MVVSKNSRVVVTKTCCVEIPSAVPTRSEFPTSHGPVVLVSTNSVAVVGTKRVAVVVTNSVVWVVTNSVVWVGTDLVAFVTVVVTQVVVFVTLSKVQTWLADVAEGRASISTSARKLPYARSLRMLVEPPSPLPANIPRITYP